MELLNGKTAFITGGARGLGAAYAKRLAGLGAKVAVADINLRAFEEFPSEIDAVDAIGVVEQINQSGGEAIEFVLDVTDLDAVERVVAKIDKKWGRLDIVICNAGGGSGTIEDSAAGSLKQEDFAAVLDRNLCGTVHTCRAVAKIMRRQGSGKIITVSSIDGLASTPDGTYAHYGMAKAAIAMYTRYLARDLGPYGITANCIAPGMVGTGRLLVRFEAIGWKAINSRVPLGRIGTVEDIAGVVEFLASDLSNYVNGAVIPIDGGLLA